MTRILFQRIPVLLPRTTWHVVIMLSAMLIVAGCSPYEHRESEVPPHPINDGIETGSGATMNARTAEPVKPMERPREETLEKGPPNDGPDTADFVTPPLHNRFVRGMVIADALTIFSFAPEVVGGDGENTLLYRWEDEKGAYFTARFEAGSLKMASRLRQRHTAPSEAPSDIESVAEIAPGVFVPLERAITSSMEQPRGVEAPPMPLPAREEEAATSEETKNAGPTIVVAGAARREREQGTDKSAEKRSYRPRARLPEFGRSLPRGRYEIRFLNPTDSPMTVGLRQDRLGTDVAVAPKGRASVFVNRGIYGLHFLCEDEPDAHYEADPITIDGFRTTDVEVHLNRDDVDVRLIDYSLPE